MIGYEAVWAADPTAWRTAGARWRAAVELIGRRDAELGSAGDRLRSAWSGPAAGTADDRLRELRADLRTGRPVLLEVDQVLAEYADRLELAKARLGAAVATAERAGLLVDRSGTVSFDPSRAGMDDATVRSAGETATDIRGALELAAVADREAARRLSDLAATGGPGWMSGPPPEPPGPGAEPAAVHRWWAGLTAAQRRWLIGRRPAAVGRLDGVPVAVRDQANQLRMGAQRAELLAALARLRAGPLTPERLVRLRRLAGALDGLDAIADRLAAEAGPRHYLLALDISGDGRAVVAVGNPDFADNVLTYVPGMTSDLPGVAGELGRVRRMTDRCTELGPTARTAGVLWLDYDAPDFLAGAASGSAALDAGPALHRFQDGLRATHDGPPARQTVLGHSYGSLVVGATARDHGLAVDSLVFVGSPGVGVEHAAELHLPADQVWASTAGNDIIQYAARSPAELARDLVQPVLAGPGPLGAAPALARLAISAVRPADELWFGHNPADPGFGGQTFDGAARGHTGYWDTGNPALDRMARIILTGRP